MSRLQVIVYGIAVAGLILLLLKVLWDQRRLKALLRKSEARYKSITGSEVIGTMIASYKGPMLEVNDTLLGMLGYSRQDLEAGCLRWDTITPPEYVQLDEGKVRDVLKTGFAREYEKQFFHKDGHRVDVWIGGIARIEGTEDLVSCCTLDITARKGVERSLQESEARFSRVVEGSNDGFWDWDLRTGQVFWSERLFAMIGESSPDDQNVPFRDFERYLPEEDRARVESAVQRCIQTGEPLHIEFKMRHRDGHYISCLSRGKPYYDGSDKVVRLAGLLTDITEQKRLQAAFQNSEARFRQLSESNLLGVAFWNIYGKIYEANDTFLRILGYDRRDVEAGLLNWQVLTLSEDQRAHAERVQKAIQGEAVLPYETRFIHREGYKIDVLVGYAMLEGSREQGFVFVLDISERKRAEQALRESEQRFRFMAEAMPQKIWTSEPDGSMDYLNSQWEDYTGQTLGKLKHWGWMDFVHPDDLQPLQSLWGQMVQEGDASQTEYRLRRFDGEYRWHLVRALPMKNGGGRTILWLGTCTDIEDLKRTQASLLESELRFRVMAESSPLQVWMLDLDRKIRYCNRRMLDFYGWTMESVADLHWEMFIESEGKASFVALLEKSYQTEMPFELEVLACRSDGEYRWTLTIGCPWFDAEGQFAGFIGSSLEIHDRKIMEQSLREREERYRLLSSAANDPIWDWDVVTDEIEWNEQFFSLFHYRPEEVEYTSAWWLKHMHPEDRERIETSLHVFFEKGGDTWVGEYRYLCADGLSFRTVLDRGFLIRDKQGRPLRMLGSLLDLTERKQYEQRVRILAESMPNKMWTALPTGQVEYVNQRWVDYTGILATETHNMDFTQIIDSADMGQVAEAWERSIAHKANFEVQARLRRYDGEYRWHLIQGSPLLDSRGEIEQILGSLTDIQEMKEIQASLMESEERFRSLADSLPFLIWLSDEKGQNIYTNKTCRDFTGGVEKDFVAQDWLAYIHPEDRDRIIQIMMRSIENQEAYYYQYRALRHDGQYRWMQVVGLPRLTREGKLTGYVGSAFDITEQKETNQILEARIQERTQQLQKSNSLLASVVENVPAMVFLKDARDLRFELFNKTGKELIGFTDAQLVGKTDYDFFPKEQADFFTAKDRETLAGGVLVDVPEEPLETVHGELLYLHTKKVPILDEQGQPAYLLGISEDITALKQNQEQIQSLNRQLEDQIRNLNAANKELESFSYTVSHDLRAPLRTIDGFSQAVLEDYEDKLDEDGKRYLARIREGSQQMAQLIDDMLNLSRLTRGELKKEIFNLSEMAESVARDLRQTEPDRQVTFVIQPNLCVDADKRLMQAVMENLLGNAWKFTSAHPTARIEFGAFQENERTVYFVKDDGAGFDMAYADKLFGTFQRLHDTVEFSGTGVGLASVHRVIHRHGGEIWAHGEVEKGATFYFTLSLM